MTTVPVPDRPEGRSARDVAERVLRTIVDPELGIDVMSMGLVYDLRVGEGIGVEVDMTLTTPGCPVSEWLPDEVDAALRGALPGVAVSVTVVWDPPWTPERLSPDALRDLGFDR
jgi:metal-sulfur cluster biosynthetic enzyme